MILRYSVHMYICLQLQQQYHRDRIYCCIVSDTLWLCQNASSTTSLQNDSTKSSISRAQLPFFLFDEKHSASELALLAGHVLDCCCVSRAPCCAREGHHRDFVATMRQCVVWRHDAFTYVRIAHNLSRVSHFNVR